ncbi:hypothetical protein C8F01DRAFT_1241979 [Mycena amicta]|nr:hypothetical protein C8F01DRAFT_1241979 [Mycena amicta]
MHRRMCKDPNRQRDENVVARSLFTLYIPTRPPLRPIFSLPESPTAAKTFQLNDTEAIHQHIKTSHEHHHHSWDGDRENAGDTNEESAGDHDARLYLDSESSDLRDELSPVDDLTIADPPNCDREFPKTKTRAEAKSRWLEMRFHFVTATL